MVIENLTFRQVEPGDLEALAAFFQGNDIPRVTRQFHPFPMTEATAILIAREVHKDRYFGAFAGGAMVGFSMLRGWDGGYETPSFGIVVDHRRCGAGIGGRLTDFVLAEAARGGVTQVRLSVYASNKPAIPLYLSRGFVEFGRDPVIVGGERDERIIMLRVSGGREREGRPLEDGGRTA